MIQLRVFVFLLVLAIYSCKEDSAVQTHEWKTLQVTATAYNSLAYQTNSNPHITAFGDSLKPGMKYIAVSRDLLALGLHHDTFVAIEGLDGIYLVKDKMHWRWKKRIDVYMGTDVAAARTWGRKKVTIHYQTPIDTLKITED